MVDTYAPGPGRSVIEWYFPNRTLGRRATLARDYQLRALRDNPLSYDLSGAVTTRSLPLLGSVSSGNVSYVFNLTPFSYLSRSFAFRQLLNII